MNTEYEPWEHVIVAYDSRKVRQVQVRERIGGVDVVETVTVRPLRAFEKQADGSVVELFGKAKDRALKAMKGFWQPIDDSEININGENDR
ncbi:hypothetical protein [Streptomyces coeruleorubidus]|uniref:hypothetical protein n=1 Tax=Streptomyces coeruleorubidus TaxID=116188 RepID=UPI0033F8052B